MSGVGKGIATSSMGKILQAKGYTVNPVKVDPYLNVDAGTMNPTEHGEVFVLDSGLETDQDMGNYERFLEVNLGPEDYLTSGMIYKHVIDKERALGYKGKCVEAIPHITGEIVRRFEQSAEKSRSDVSLIEIGGTVGDYQNVLFIEAARTLKLKHPRDVMFVMVSYLPVPGSIGEMKTRPTQHAVRQLNSYGVQPDMIIARGPVAIDHKRKEKIAVSCNMLTDNVISAPDIASVYDVPINFEQDKLGERILDILSLPQRPKRDGLAVWRKFVSRSKSSSREVHIAIVGKYFDTGEFVLSDAYISVIESIKYSAYALGIKPMLHWLSSKDFENGTSPISSLDSYAGVIVPGGFGETGIEGKIAVIQYCREQKIPYFGLCYGMQLLVVEFARHVLKLSGAHTTEINPDAEHKIIDIMPDQKKKLAEGNYGGSMRLGSYPAQLADRTIARSAYGVSEINERHRHRFEVNPLYVSQLEEGGLVFSGKSPDGLLCEIAELPKAQHPFFLGTQFHPEFKARPLAPHPLFTAFLKAALQQIK